MTKALQKAYEEAAKLPEEQQEALAVILKEELAIVRRRASSLPKSKSLTEIAKEAINEDK